MHVPSLTGLQRAMFATAAAVILLGAVALVHANSHPKLIENAAAAGAEHLVASGTVPGTTAHARQVVLHVSGMYCVSCEHTITAMLKRAPGVQRAVVSVQRSQAIVVYDPAKTSPAKIIEVITNLGYRATVQRA